MNTAARDRALLPTVKDALRDEGNRRTPISKLQTFKEKDGSIRVALHSSRPNNIRMRSNEITIAIRELTGEDVPVRVQVVPEARAVAKYVRTSPRKARLVADAIKGKRVSEAIALLRFVPNRAAELISKVLISAAANAMDGWGADVEELKVHNVIADGGPSLKRVKPRAQGRAYRIVKRTSHLTVILTEAAPAAARTRRPVQARPRPAARPTPTAPARTAIVAEDADIAVAAEAAEPIVLEEPGSFVDAVSSEQIDVTAAETGADQNKEKGE